MLPDSKRFLPKYTLRMFNMPQFPFGQRWCQKRGWKEPPEPPEQRAPSLRYLLSRGAGRALCFWGWWTQLPLGSRLRRSQVMSRQSLNASFSSESRNVPELDGAGGGSSPGPLSHGFWLQTGRRVPLAAVRWAPRSDWGRLRNPAGSGWIGFDLPTQGGFNQPRPSLSWNALRVRPQVNKMSP